MQGGTLYGTPGEISTPPLPKPRLVLTDTVAAPFDFWQKARGIGHAPVIRIYDQCPLQLARWLTAQPGNQKVGVLNEGIAGNRLLHDSFGPNGLARFDREALTQTGVTHVVVQTGVNDIGVGWSGGL